MTLARKYSKYNLPQQFAEMLLLQNKQWWAPEVESSRMSLASRTHFQVLGLEASSPRKLPCPRLEESTIFWTVEILLESARNLAENLRRPFLFSSSGNRLKKNFEDLFCLKKTFEDVFFWDRLKNFFENLLFFWRTLASVSLVLGLERVCPWSRNFFVSLALASSLVSSTPPLMGTAALFYSGATSELFRTFNELYSELFRHQRKAAAPLFFRSKKQQRFSAVFFFSKFSAAAANKLLPRLFSILIFTRYRLESLQFFFTLLSLLHYFSLVEQTMLPLWRFVVV